MDLVIVESPAKAKTISKYLDNAYTVLASYGHVRDLPSREGSVTPEEDFRMTWDTDARSKKRLDEISVAMKKASRLILATDPDREGEAISWHVLEVLRQKKVLKDQTVQRVVFNAVTRKSVLEAMENPRELDHELIDAYLARRALDYLVGFNLSPVLWRKLPGARSAGRVQSVTLRLICERELEIERFVRQEYWTLGARMRTGSEGEFNARLYELDGRKIEKFDIGNAEDAASAQKKIESGRYTVKLVESKPGRRNPSPPFTTSTLQQEASRKMGFSAARTMQIAQQLYEGIDIAGETAGLVTYMRTDGVSISPEALARIRNTIQTGFGEPYLPSAPLEYKVKARNAQEAHEAIRPTDPARLPADLKTLLNDDQFRLYDLIWKRTLASQMESVKLERTTMTITSEQGDVILRATGSVILFDGFLKLYQEGRDDETGGEEAGHLPKVSMGDPLGLVSVEPKQHFTEPPPRFTEASLVKRMEELGIGRPSTYASTLSVIRDRGYATMDRNRFVPDGKGLLVTAFLESFFTRYVEYSFTADLEEKLDKISSGQLKWKDVLQEFWDQFTATIEGTSDLRIGQVLDRLNEVLGSHVFPKKDGDDSPRACPQCDKGALSIKVGRFGAFVGCSSYPDCKFTRPLSSSDENQGVQEKLLGVDPETSRDIYLKEGRFGPYVQRAGGGENDEKPKNAGLPKTWDPAEMDMEKALRLLSLPREVGTHPEDGKKITAGLGRFGPFVLHNKVYASLENPDEIFTVGLNRAVTLIAEKLANPGKRRTPKALKELGEHPEDGEPVQVLDGRYGPYVKHGKTNATLPSGTDPQAVTLEEALRLVAEKAGKTTRKKKTASAKKKTTSKKKTAKKAAKKTTRKTTAKKSKPAKTPETAGLKD